MVTIKSLEDLKKMREEAQRKQELKSATTWIMSLSGKPATSGSIPSSQLCR